MTTPEELVADHEVTQKLKAWGVTEAQLVAMHFDKTQGLPFKNRPYTWDPDMIPVPLPLIKQYCTLKLLLLDNPPPSRDRDDAEVYMSSLMIAQLIEFGTKALDNQRIRAAKPRGKLEGGQSLEEIIHRLAAQPEHRDKTALELWPQLFSPLDDLGLDPKEIPHPTDARKTAYDYDFHGKRKKLSFGQFANLLSEFRRSAHSA